MNLKNKIAALTILTAFNFSVVAQAASIDEELAVIAAEQEEPFSIEKKPEQTKNNVAPEKKSRKELRAEERRLREERRAEEKKIKEDMKNAEREFKEAQEKSKDQDKNKLKITERNSSQKNFPKIDPVSPQTEKVELERKPETTPTVEPESEVVTFDPKLEPTPTAEPVTPKLTTPTPAAEPTPPPVTPIPEPVQPTQPVNLANPLVQYSNFEELADAVNFTPLYIPKKAGFSIDSLAAIDGRIAEIRYGRRWEPEVSLRVRTYKRADGEELKDISGVNGVKWRVDMSSGTSVYIAKIDENKHVAAWASGDYTFSAQVENLSFAAFHAIVVDELVDLSNHYYMK